MSPSYNLKRILHDLGDGQCGITEHPEGKSDNFFAWSSASLTLYDQAVVDDL